MSNSSNHTVSNSVTNSNSLRVDSSALIGHLSHVSVNIVGVVVDMLDAAIRKVDRVGSLPSSRAIVRLRSVKTSSRVVVSHSVLVGVGRNLVGVHLRHGMTHNCMPDTNTMSNAMSNTNTMSNANTVTNANSMADANAVSKSNTMSDPSKELRSGRCGNCHQKDRGGRDLHADLKWLLTPM